MTPVGWYWLKQRLQWRSVANVHLFEDVSRIAGDRFQGMQIRRIGKLVDIDDEGATLIDQLPTDRGADEAGPSGHKNPGQILLHVNGVGVSMEVNGEFFERR